MVNGYPYGPSGGESNWWIWIIIFAIILICIFPSLCGGHKGYY